MTTSSSFGLVERDYCAEILQELPGSGEIHSFPPSITERPLIVRFVPTDRPAWVGCFGAGTLSRAACSGLFPLPGGARACVVSVGRAFAVDVRAPAKTEIVIHELIMEALPAPAAGVLLLSDPWQVYALGEIGKEWCSARLSIEGLALVGVEGDTLVVRARNQDDEFEERRLDIRTGALL